MYTSKPCKRLLVGVTGSVHCIHISQYLLEFRKVFCDELRVIMTPAAAEMIDPRVVELYADAPVTTSMWGTGHEGQAPHVRLPRWAELFVVVPASANTIGKVAAGVADSALTAAILSSADKVIFAPAMNPTMFANRRVQQNLATLSEDGHHVVQPDELVSATTGEFDVGLGPNPELVLRHMWHVLMRRANKELWSEATAAAPTHPSGKLAMPVPVVRRRPAKQRDSAVRTSAREQVPASGELGGDKEERIDASRTGEHPRPGARAPRGKSKAAKAGSRDSGRLPKS